MLIKITNKCQMNCIHCVENATKDGTHMDYSVFLDAIKFAQQLNPSVILLSGGEPTEHPDFFQMVEYLKAQKFKKTPLIIVASNGMFLANDEFTQKCINLNIFFQITNDKRYYPQEINQRKDLGLNFMFENHIQSLTRLGRAKENNMSPINSVAPKCFNLRSFVINSKLSFFSAITMLDSIGKYCTPSIDIDGNIRMGEFSLCYCIGNINDSEQILTDNILKMKNQCNKCGMEDALLPIHRKAIGLNNKE